MQRNFNRQYRVRIGKNGAAGVELGKNNTSTGRALRCQFSVEVGESVSSNTGKISIWNLSKETLQLLEQEDCLIELRAGYDNDIPVIMGGTVTCVSTSSDSADKQTTSEFADSFSSARDGTVSLSYSGNVNGKKIIDDCAVEIGCGVRYSKSASFPDLKNFAFVGNGKTLIGKICKLANLRWSVQNGIVQVCAVDEPITNAAYLLSADTGLVGTPAPYFDSAQSSDKSSSSGSSSKSSSKSSKKNSTKRKSKKGLEVTYFLNGHIHVDDYIRLESRDYKGNYRVSKIAFSGDTDGGDWACKAQIVEVK